MSATEIDFWFDFSSAYAYFAALRLDELTARTGRSVRWRPYMLGTAFKVTGGRGLSSTPLKRDYARRDWQRLSARHAVPFDPPPDHPLVALAATRVFYLLEEAAPAQVVPFAKAVFRDYYRGALDTSDAKAVVDLAVAIGAGEASALLAGIGAPDLKERVKQISEQAIALGVFGSPFFIVDGEPFWGSDRIDMMVDWILSGGW